MAGSITRTACPKCGAIGYLHIEAKMVAKPLGTWSLSGNQVKTVAGMKPFLKCHNCDLDIQGDWDGNSHAVFPQEVTSGQAQPEG